MLSARWAGGHGDDEANLRLVLDQLRDVPPGRRGAAFFCAAVAARIGADGQIQVLAAAGQVHGAITPTPVGSNGFGYDPIFRPDGSDLTTAQMDATARTAPVPITGRKCPLMCMKPHLPLAD